MKLLFKQTHLALLFLFMPGILVRVLGQEDVAHIPSEKISIRVKETETFYYLVGEHGSKANKNPSGLAVILPGGDGRAENFLPFVKRIYNYVLKERNTLIALPDASYGDQKIVWPTKLAKVDGMKYSTEEYVEAILEDVSKRCKIDSSRTILMAWSSGGPAAYWISLSQDKIRGFYILMSVYWKAGESELKKAGGKVYFLEHSPEDTVCPFWNANWAKKELEKNGAKVTIAEYKGGHGFHGAVYPRMKEAFGWIEKEIKKKKK